jgi:hypothetical protein
MMTSDVSCGRALHLVDNESCHLTPREPHDTTRKCLARRELTAFARSKDKDHSNRDSFRWHDVVARWVYERRPVFPSACIALMPEAQESSGQFRANRGSVAVSGDCNVGRSPFTSRVNNAIARSLPAAGNEFRLHEFHQPARCVVICFTYST